MPFRISQMKNTETIDTSDLSVISGICGRNEIEKGSKTGHSSNYQGFKHVRSSWHRAAWSLRSPVRATRPHQAGLFGRAIVLTRSRHLPTPHACHLENRPLIGGGFKTAADKATASHASSASPQAVDHTATCGAAAHTCLHAPTGATISHGGRSMLKESAPMWVHQRLHRHWPRPRPWQTSTAATHAQLRQQRMRGITASRKSINQSINQFIEMLTQRPRSCLASLVLILGHTCARHGGAASERERPYTGKRPAPPAVDDQLLPVPHLRRDEERVSAELSDSDDKHNAAAGGDGGRRQQMENMNEMQTSAALH